MTYTLGAELATVAELPTFSVVPDTIDISGQAASILTPTGGPGHAAVIYCHPLGGDGVNVLTDTICAQMARWGFPVIGGECGGLTAWNNPDSQTDIDACVDYAINTMGADPDHVLLYGLSMGGTSSLKWISDNLALVDGWVGLSPAVSMDYFYTTQSQVTINGAFGGAPGWAAAAPTHDPQLLAEAGLLDGLHGKIWDGSNDTTIGSPPTVAAFMAEVPTVTNFEYDYGTGGHFDVVATDAVSVASFLARSYAPTAALFGLAL